MSLSDEERDVLVSLEIEKAEKTFSQASMCVENQMWDMLANRLYYSLFHAVSALFIRNKIQVGTHKGMVVMLGKEFVIKGVLTVDEAHTVSRLQQLREEGDYNCHIETTQAEIVPFVDKTKALIDKIKTLVVV